MASVDNAIAHILSERFDNDMVAVLISPDMRMAVVGSPDYFSKHGFAKAPEELSKQSCFNIRPPTHGGYLVWEFERDGKDSSGPTHDLQQCGHGTHGRSFWRGPGVPARVCQL